MRWDNLNITGCLFCTQASQQDISAIVQKTGAFLSGCKSRYPGVRRELEDGLTDFIQALSAGATASPMLNLAAIKLLLRWCVTDGRHLQDFRRDNARALWRVLFRGPIPDFFRYHALTGDYKEDLHERESWIQTQVRDCKPSVAHGAECC